MILKNFDSTKHDVHCIDSPCVRNCCLNEQDICIGCLRSLDEIKRWYQSDNHQKQQILINAKKRKLIK